MNETRDFLLEIGVEEMPPKALAEMIDSFQLHLQQALDHVKLAHGEILTFITPRRLAVIVRQLANKQLDQLLELKGPMVQQAFNADGTSTKAGQSFANSCGMEINKLEQVEDKNGKRLMCKTTKMGVAAKQLLPDIVMQALKQMPIPRIMRWGEGNFSFVRPVHWVVMLYGNEVVDGEIFGIKTGNKTYGHRFHCPHELIIDDVNKYADILQQQGYVIADLQKRKALIREKVMQVVGNLGNAIIEEDLLSEVAGLVEWPVALLCKFEERFLKNPQEVLSLVLQKQQRCFPIVDNNQKITRYFVAISNIESKDKQCVIDGYERVVHARLFDAEFFYQTDLQYTLDSYLDNLKIAIFQTNLGSIYDRTQRLMQLAVDIAKKIGANALYVRRAAELAKSDLMTTMVGEFPELQGEIGYYYALQQKEPEEVAIALREQYLPRFAEDQLPKTAVGCALGVAERVDLLMGIFALNKPPTGAKDPFGLRRAVFSILRIVFTNQWELDIKELLQLAMVYYRRQQENFDEILFKNYGISSKEHETTIDELINKVINLTLDFVLERLRTWYVDRGIQVNIFNAVRELVSQKGHTIKLLDFDKRIEAIVFFKTLPEAEALSIAHKRVKNILKKEQYEGKAEFKRKLLAEEAEIQLADKLEQRSAEIKFLCDKGEYREALGVLAEFKSAVDYFFNTVRVMVDNKKLCNNRLALLKTLHDLFNCVADISCLAAE